MKNTNYFKIASTVVVHVSRLVIGAVFVFSGFVKAIDPLGYTYKIEEYLSAFGGFFANFTPLAFTAAIALSAIELLIGLNLLFSVRLKETSIVALLFMLFYTPLTFYIWLTDPVTDCGCFGDALIISNGATFAKNLILLVLAIALLACLKGKKSFWQPRVEWAMVLIFIGLGFGLQIYSYCHLPMIDFRPYKIGTYIPEKMEYPENAPNDVYEMLFIYKNNETGKQRDFKLQGTKMIDVKDKTEYEFSEFAENWTFVDQNTKLIKKGYTPPIHDFTITDEDGYDITYDVLGYEGYSYFLVMYDLKKTSIKGAQIAEKIYQKYKDTNVKFYALTAVNDDEIEMFKEKAGVSFPFYKTDATQLKTMIRANPGLILIKNGTVEGMWNWRNLGDLRFKLIL